MVSVDGDRYELQVRRDDSVVTTVQQALGQGYFRLFFGGEDIIDDGSFGDYGIETGARLVARERQAWQWATSDGTPVLTYDEATATYEALLGLLDIVSQTTGEDSEAEDYPEAGIVVVDAAVPFPESPAEILAFLRGEEHMPVIPACDYDLNSSKRTPGERYDAGGSDPDLWASTPWYDLRDADQFIEVDAAGLFEPNGRRNLRWGMTEETRYYGQISSASEERAAEILTCSERGATKADMQGCKFFTYRGPVPHEDGDYFRAEKSRGERMYPYLMIGTNPSKRTIAFTYTACWWI